MGQESLNRLSLGTLRCVKEVLSHGNVTMAAGRLGITQPAVSQQVARFEKLSGIPVMSRTGNSLIMRPEAITPLIEAFAQVERALDGISCSEAVLKPRLGICQHAVANHCCNALLEELLEEFHVHVGSFHVVTTMFAHGKLDAVVRPILPSEAETDLTTTTRLVWVAGRNNPLSNGPPEGAQWLCMIGGPTPDGSVHEGPVDWVWRRPGGGKVFVHNGDHIEAFCSDPRHQPNLLHDILEALVFSGEPAGLSS